MPLPPQLLPRVDPLVRRLASGFDGERLACLLALERTLTAAQASFHDLADAIAAGVIAAAADRAPPPDAYGMLVVLLKTPGLTAWEAGFVDDVFGQYRRCRWLSRKQQDVLTRIWRERAA